MERLNYPKVQGWWIVANAKDPQNFAAPVSCSQNTSLSNAAKLAGM